MKKVLYEFEGEQLGLKEISERTGIKVCTLRKRMNSGQSFEEAIGTPVREYTVPEPEQTLSEQDSMANLAAEMDATIQQHQFNNIQYIPLGARDIMTVSPYRIPWWIERGIDPNGGHIAPRKKVVCLNPEANPWTRVIEIRRYPNDEYDSKSNRDGSVRWILQSSKKNT